MGTAGEYWVTKQDSNRGNAMLTFQLAGLLMLSLFFAALIGPRCRGADC